MSVVILHGDHSSKSFERLKGYLKIAKSKGIEIRRISAEDNLPEKLASNSLFANHTLFVVDEIKKANKKDLKWLRENLKNLDHDLIIYQASPLTRTILNFFPSAKIEEFRLPKLIWKFLDEFYPGNSQNILKLLHQIIKNEAPELIVGLLNWRLTDIYIFLKEPEKISYETWRLIKLGKQAKKFTEKKVLRILNELAKADFESKIGRTQILTSLDLIIASELE